MQYSQLIARIQADIYNNGAELITGDILQGDLLAIISALASAGAGYGGIITPGSSAPASLDQATFYLAIQPGTYSSFGVTVTEPSIVSYGGGSTLTFTVSPLGLAPAPTVVKLNTGDNPYVLVPLTGTDGMAFTVDIDGGYSGGSTEVYAQRWLVNYSTDNGATIYVSGDKVRTGMIAWARVYEYDGGYFLVLNVNTSDLDYVTMAFRDMTGDPVPGITAEPNITGYVYSSDAVLTNPEYQNNKVTFIDAVSSDIQYPSAKAVYDAIQNSRGVFVATIGATTYAECEAAYNAGKILIAVDYDAPDYYVYVLDHFDNEGDPDGSFEFVRPVTDGYAGLTRWYLSYDDIWSDSSVVMQERLVSGTNIKTINFQSILGSGNITIDADTSDCVKYTQQSKTDEEKTIARENIGAAPSIGVAPSLTVGTILGEAVGESFSAKIADEITDGYAAVSEVKGKSVVLNQLLRSRESTTINGVIFTNNGDGSYTVNADGSQSAETNFSFSAINGISGHIYYLAGHNPAARNNSFQFRDGNGYLSGDWGTGVIKKISSNGKIIPQLSVRASIVCDNEIFWPIIIDLTKMFGAGKEPSTVEEFEAMFPLDYYDYNVGELLSNKTSAIVVKDASNAEIGRLTLNISTITGKLNGEGESVTIFPDGMRGAGTAYDYLVVDADGYARRAVKVMDVEDLGSLNWVYKTPSGGQPNFESSVVSNVRKPLSNSIFFSWQINARYAGNNVSNIVSVTKPDKAIGLNTIGALIISDSSYTDAATFKAAMSGFELVYELAAPLEYVLDSPIKMTFPIEDGATLSQLPTQTSASVLSAPMAWSIRYPYGLTREAVTRLFQITGSGAPTITPSFIGQMYIDTTNNKVYVATDTTNSSSFKVLN